MAKARLKGVFCSETPASSAYQHGAYAELVKLVQLRVGSPLAHVMFARGA